MRMKRLFGFFAAGVVLAGGILFYLHFFLSAPVGSGPAGPIVAKDAFSKPWTQRDVLLVGIGDSVTAGFGARKGYSYFDRLVTNSTDEAAEMKGISLSAVLPNLRVTNLSVSGSTSAEHAERQIPLLSQQASNTLGIVVITTGGNDLIHNYGRTPPRDQAMYGASLEQAQPWLLGYSNRLESMIQQIESRFPGGVEIYLANIFDPTDEKGDIQRAGLPAWKDGLSLLASYNQIISDAVARHRNAHLVDIHSAFLGHGIHCAQFWSTHYDRHDPHYWYYSNLEDPNERGYDAMRRLFLIEMAKTSDRIK